jgi:small conductance mechanosensitive channel
VNSTLLDRTINTAIATLTNVGLKVIGAIVLYLVGRALINWMISLVQRALERQKVDPTLLRYVGTVISVLANIALVIAILGYFGVETTSFAALLAGAGIAIGTAWGGLLSNFASGAFLVILRPYRVGDFVNLADVTGTVRAIGLFVTTIDTPDGVQTHVGNGKIPNVAKDPAPDVEILTFTEFGPVLAVRPYTHTDHYWQVYFAGNKAIVAVAGEAQFPPVERNVRMKNPA